MAVFSALFVTIMVTVMSPDPEAALWTALADDYPGRPIDLEVRAFLYHPVFPINHTQFLWSMKVVFIFGRNIRVGKKEPS